MTATQVTSLPATATETPPTCPCGCLTPTTRLFAPGHDSRYKSYLRRTFADTPEPRFTSHVAVVWLAETVSLDEAVARIRAVTGSDWLPLVTKPFAPPKTLPERRKRSVAREDTVATLLETLAGRPLTGQWGWWRPEAPVEALRDARFPARVFRTYRDAGSNLVDLVVHFEHGPEYVRQVLPSTWVRDETAKP